MFLYSGGQGLLLSLQEMKLSPLKGTWAGQGKRYKQLHLNAFCREQGAEPVILGLCRDNFNDLKILVEKRASCADTLFISGGSSVGARDMTLKVLGSFDHNGNPCSRHINSPGKPTIIAKVGNRAVFGLPGHVASAMVVAEVFLKEFIRRLSGGSRDDTV
jgi:molybdopterin molybdotransferase